MVIQAMISSIQVPSRTKDLEMDVTNEVKDVTGRRISKTDFDVKNTCFPCFSLSRSWFSKWFEVILLVG